MDPAQRLNVIQGTVPNLLRIPVGCRFAPRCPAKMPECDTTAPALLDRDGTSVRCLLYAPRLEAKPKEAAQ